MHRIYRSAGASLEKAQGEFAKGVATNPHVQNAAGEAASAGVRNAMSGSNTKWWSSQWLKRKLATSKREVDLWRPRISLWK